MYVPIRHFETYISPLAVQVLLQLATSKAQSDLLVNWVKVVPSFAQVLLWYSMRSDAFDCKDTLGRGVAVDA
jgi:hypothetical protein